VRGDRSYRFPLLGAAGALLAVACCAGLPALAAIVGGLTVAAVIGISTGALLAALVASLAVLIWRGRRRRACEGSRGTGRRDA
jgi:membrane protein implicated in regulation of membrane protease activity